MKFIARFRDISDGSDVTVEKIDISQNDATVDEEGTEPQESEGNLIAFIIGADSKYVMLSCPQCGKQEGKMANGYICTHCLETVAIVNGKHTAHFIPFSLKRGDMLGRGVDQWVYVDDSEDLDDYTKLVTLRNISQSLILDVSDLQISVENGKDDLRRFVRPFANQEMFLLEWRQEGAFIVECLKCSNRSFAPITLILCPDCNKVYIPCSNKVIPIEDGQEDNRELPCYISLSTRSFTENQETLDSIKVYNAQDVMREYTEVLCSYSVIMGKTEQCSTTQTE